MLTLKDLPEIDNIRISEWEELLALPLAKNKKKTRVYKELKPRNHATLYPNRAMYFIREKWIQYKEENNISENTLYWIAQTLYITLVMNMDNDTKSKNYDYSYPGVDMLAELLLTDKGRVTNSKAFEFLIYTGLVKREIRLVNGYKKSYKYKLFCLTDTGEIKSIREFFSFIRPKMAKAHQEHIEGEKYAYLDDYPVE